MPFQTYQVSTVFCCQCPASQYLLQECPPQSLEEFSDHRLEVFILFLRQWFQLKLTRLLKPFSFFFGGWKVALSSMPSEHITYCNFWPLKRNLLICVVISNTQKVLTDYLVLICLPCSCTILQPARGWLLVTSTCSAGPLSCRSVTRAQSSLYLAPVVCMEIVLSSWSTCVLSLFCQCFDLHEKEFGSFRGSMMEQTIKYSLVWLAWRDICNIFGDICFEWLVQANP